MRELLTTNHLCRASHQTRSWGDSVRLWAIVHAFAYTIRLSSSRDGQLIWDSARSTAARLSEESAAETRSQFTQRVFYDDHRGRRLIYEVNLDRDEFRYVLECSNDDHVQRLVFPTLRAAVFCLVGCINRNE
jgi:hypothetical protein